MGKYRSIVLTKLTSPPGLEMIREALIKTQEFPGNTVQIPFGRGGTEEYDLSACATSESRDLVCSWTLYRGERANSAVEWTYVGDDTEQVISYLTTRFPGWSQQTKLITPEVKSVKNQLRTASGVKLSKRSTLEGDLSDMSITNLLQSMAMNKVNGRLEVRDGPNEATVWFEQGVLADCQLPGAIGDDALIELICWKTGEFYFFPEFKIENHSVKKRLEILIMEGAIFHDLYTALLKLNFSFDSIVFRKSETLSEAEFDQIVGGGIPVDLGLQKRIYYALTPQTPIFQLMQALNLSKIQLVPIIFNLLSLDVVALKEAILSASGEWIAANSESLGEIEQELKVESSENHSNWRVVKKKSEVAPLAENVHSHSVNFANKIREITAVSGSLKRGATGSTKKRGIARLVFGGLLQLILLILFVVLNYLYLEGFHIKQASLNSGVSPLSSRPVLHKAQRTRK